MVAISHSSLHCHSSLFRIPLGVGAWAWPGLVAGFLWGSGAAIHRQISQGYFRLCHEHGPLDLPGSCVFRANDGSLSAVPDGGLTAALCLARSSLNTKRGHDYWWLSLILSLLPSLVFSMSKAAMSSRLNLRSPRGPRRYTFTIPCSLHLLSVLACMQRIRHASPVLSRLLEALTYSGTAFLVCVVCTVSPVVSQPCGNAPAVHGTRCAANHRFYTLLF